MFVYVVVVTMSTRCLVETKQKLYKRLQTILKYKQMTLPSLNVSDVIVSSYIPEDVFGSCISISCLEAPNYFIYLNVQVISLLFILCTNKLSYNFLKCYYNVLQKRMCWILRLGEGQFLSLSSGGMITSLTCKLIMQTPCQKQDMTSYSSGQPDDGPLTDGYRPSNRHQFCW